MTPWTLLGSAAIPNDGGELRLTQRNNEFSIHVSGARGELMNSRMYSSEEALAELGCSHLAKVGNARVLVGGMGMGFTLAAALKATNASAEVTVAELIPEVIEWNRGPLGECAGRPLDDPRTRIHLGDVAGLFKTKKAKRVMFDAILLDVDNGPEGFTQTDNSSLYSVNSLQAMKDTLNPGGVLAIWSAWHDPSFTPLLQKVGFFAETKTVRAHKGKGSKHTIYLAKADW